MITNLFQLLNFFLIYFLSVIDSFNVFSYSKVTTLIQSLNFVYLVFTLLIYSFAIKIAIDVRRAVELVNTIPMLGLINDLVKLVIVDPDPNINSLIINNTFFFLNFYISPYNIHYQF